MTTSVLMHLRPELVHTDRIPNHPPIHYPPYDVFPPDPAAGSTTGVLCLCVRRVGREGRPAVQRVRRGNLDGDDRCVRPRGPFMSGDFAFMRRVIELSRQGMLGGHGFPFGAVIVKDGEIVGEAHNEVVSSSDPTAHAELLAVRRASARLKSVSLAGCELYTNAAPCCMCMASMLWARIDRAYYALAMADFQAIGLGDEPFYEELARPLEARRILPMVQLPEFAAEARAVLELWVAQDGEDGVVMAAPPQRRSRWI